MVKPADDLLAFQREAYKATIASQDVIRMRMLQFALGEGTWTEAATMVTEKAEAFFQAQAAVGLCMAQGRPASAPLDALRCYSAHIEANQTRLAIKAK